jgi:hypothetical protein
METAPRSWESCCTCSHHFILGFVQKWWIPKNDNSNGENRDEPLDLGVPYVQTHVCLWLMSLSSLSPRVWIDWTSSYAMITRLLCTSMHHSPWGSSVVPVFSWSFCGLCGLVNHEVPVKNAISLARPRRELSSFRWKNWRKPWTSLRPIFLGSSFLSQNYGYFWWNSNVSKHTETHKHMNSGAKNAPKHGNSDIHKNPRHSVGMGQ